MRHRGFMEHIVSSEKRILGYQFWDWKTLPKFWLNALVFIRLRKESSLIPTLRFEILANILTECLSSSGWWRLKHSVETSAKLSDLNVGMRELSFPLMQEPTEKQPLWILYLIKCMDNFCERLIYIRFVSALLEYRFNITVTSNWPGWHTASCTPIPSLLSH